MTGRRMGNPAWTWSCMPDISTAKRSGAAFGDPFLARSASMRCGCRVAQARNISSSGPGWVRNHSQWNSIICALSLRSNWS